MAPYLAPTGSASQAKRRCAVLLALPSRIDREPSEPGRGSHRVGSASTPVAVGQGLGPPNFHERLDRVCCCSTSPSLRDALGHAKGVFAQGRSLSHRGSECLRIKALRGEPDADTGVFDSTSNLQLIAPVRHHDYGHPRGECSLGDAHPTMTDDGSSAREDRAVGKETLQDYPFRRDLKIVPGRGLLLLRRRSSRLQAGTRGRSG